MKNDLDAHNVTPDRQEDRFALDGSRNSTVLGSAKLKPAASRMHGLSALLWLRKTSNLKSFAIPTTAECGETDAFAGQMQK
jgi:hypothetical protein